MDVNWIRQKMRERGLTQVELAAGIGMTQNMLTKSLNGHRLLQADEVDNIRRFFGYKLPEDLPPYITIDAVVMPDDQVQLLPPGKHRQIVINDPILQVYPTGNVAQVRGAAAEPWALDGDLIFWGAPTEALSRDIGRPVIAQVKDGPLVLKRLASGSKAGVWSLLSINPTHQSLFDVKIEWASRAMAYLPTDQLGPIAG